MTRRRVGVYAAIISQTETMSDSIHGNEIDINDRLAYYPHYTWSWLVPKDSII